ncbi:MAG TPA: class I adenylate-forming enzyme family protein [Methanocorpusculum sp.]|nr:class I adenylate-forming enzyme family protein [Methanocorpusculum sp.]
MIENKRQRFQYNFNEEHTESLYTMLKYGAETAGLSGEALYYFGRRITYGELLDAVEEFASGLADIGVKKGDSITIYLPNIPQCIIAVYAVNRLGAVCNLVHPLLSVNELRYAVELTKSRYILAFEGNEAVCKGLGAKVIRCRMATYFPEGIKGMVMRAAYQHSIRNVEKVSDALEWTDILQKGRLCRKLGKKLAEHLSAADDTAAVMYTGGTTGVPKGVLLSNKAINYNTATLIESLFHGNVPEPGTAFLGVLPVFHAFGFGVVIHQPLAGGMRLVLVPKFEPKACAKLILREKIYAVVGVPAMFEKMYEYLQNKDLAFIKIIGSGGDLVSHELIERYNAILPSTVFRLGYGLTEASGCCLFTAEGDDRLEQGTVGMCMGNTEICLVEPGTTTVIPDSEEGELCIRNSSLMTGYYQNRKATAAVLRKHADGNIWLHTGDMASISKNRNVLFRSRYKRMVKVNGFNVYPSVIEDTMSSCPAVREICAKGIPWDQSSRIKFYVTLNDPAMNQDEAVEEIKEYAYHHLNRWSCPKEVKIIAEMPRTKMNKIDYQALEDEIAGG